jgi:alpha-L-rhamnosidase
MIENGASTIWELWNGNTADPSMNSGNHVMLLGDLMIWYHEKLIGIKSEDEGNPFKHFTINPYFAPQLNYLNGSYESPYGKIISNWKKAGSVLNWEVFVPTNTSALIYMPTNSAEHILVDGKHISECSYIKVVKSNDNKVMLNLSSGDYKFTIN